MSKINVNGVTREMTAEEESSYMEANQMAEMADGNHSVDNRIAALEAALAALIGGEVE